MALRLLPLGRLTRRRNPLAMYNVDYTYQRHRTVPCLFWLPETAYSHNGKPLDAYTIPYVVAPIGDNTVALGDSALLINHDTGMRVMCVVGERGFSENGWGEVSIVAIWETGNPEHMTANHTEGLSHNYEIVVYPGIPYEWR